MTKTERFIAEVKNLVHRKGSTKQWDLFALTAKEFRLGTIRDIAETLYKATVNRTLSVKMSRAYWNLVTAYVLINDFGFSTLQPIVRQALEQLFEYNTSQGIGRPFKEVLGKEVRLWGELTDASFSFAQRLCGTVLLSSGIIDPSAIRGARQLGATLLQISRIRRGLQTLRYFQKKQYKKVRYVGVSLVYTLTRPYVALQPNCILPPFTDTSLSSRAFFKEFAPLALRFPAFEELNSQYKDAIAQRDESLADIADLHHDLTQGGKRKQLMTRLSRLVNKYCQV